MDLIFLRDWIKSRADIAEVSYSEIETLFDVNELLNQDMPCLMFNYEQEENQYKDSPFTRINLKLFFIKNFHNEDKVETEPLQRDFLSTEKNKLREVYKKFIEVFQREETPIIEVISDTQLQLAEKVSVEGYLIMEATVTIDVERDFCLSTDGQPLPPLECLPVTVFNSNSSFSETIPSGQSLTLPDTTYIITVDGVAQPPFDLPTLEDNTINIIWI